MNNESKVQENAVNVCYLKNIFSKINLNQSVYIYELNANINKKTVKYPI